LIVEEETENKQESLGLRLLDNDVSFGEAAFVSARAHDENPVEERNTAAINISGVLLTLRQTTVMEGVQGALTDQKVNSRPKVIVDDLLPWCVHCNPPNFILRVWV
jgi:hypothetical protein